MNKGYLAAFAAYIVWGLSPIYWKIVSTVPALEILGLRILWSIPLLLIVLWIRRDFSAYKLILGAPGRYKVFLLSPLLLATNWLIWIWSVNNNHVVDASLGYFINPLVNVALGVVFLHERLRRVQWLALGLALIGVLYLTLNYGQFPWIALTLAGSFSLYGYLRKIARLGAIDGLAIEVLMMIIPLLVLIWYLNHAGNLTVPDLDLQMHGWLSLSGVITVFTLVVFAFGARKIPYSTLGFIQYIAPSMQFLLGIYLFNEAFSIEKLIGFVFIWVALIIYSLENLYFINQKRVLTASLVRK